MHRNSHSASQREEKLCKSMIRGFVRRKSEGRAKLADPKEEQKQDVTCSDDITGKELPWHADRKARDLDDKYLRYLKSMES